MKMLRSALVGAALIASVAAANAQPPFPYQAVGADGSTRTVTPHADVESLPFGGAVAMTVGTAYSAQRSFGVVCTTAGNVSVTFQDNSTFVVPVVVGYQAFPFAVTTVNTSGTTATCTYANFK